MLRETTLGKVRGVIDSLWRKCYTMLSLAKGERNNDYIHERTLSLISH